MKYCVYCGKQLNDTDIFCSGCGRKSNSASRADTASAPQGEIKQDVNNVDASEIKEPPQPVVCDDGFVDEPAYLPFMYDPEAAGLKWYDRLILSISRMTGGAKVIRPPLKTIFSQILCRHKKTESDEIFICGTENTTPELSDDDNAWPHPWLWTRILLAFVAAFVLLHICCNAFENLNAYPGLMVIGSFMIPVAIMVFFFELNTPKNISFFTTMKYFLVGGCASLLVTLLLFEIFSFDVNENLFAIIIGIIEELGKLAIVAIIIWSNKNAKYALNGLLIGAAIGAGFAAFESAGYAFNVFMGSFMYSGNISFSYDEMIDNILLRAVLAPGGHVIWAAMSGYAVMIVKNGKNTMNFFSKKAFWKIFWMPIALHAIWDMPIKIGDGLVGSLVHIVCVIIIGWIVMFVMIGNALSEIGSILEKRKAESEKTDKVEVLTE